MMPGRGEFPDCQFVQGNSFTQDPVKHGRVFAPVVAHSDREGQLVIRIKVHGMQGRQGCRTGQTLSSTAVIIVELIFDIVDFCRVLPYLLIQQRNVLCRAVVFFNVIVVILDAGFFVNGITGNNSGIAFFNFAVALHIDSIGILYFSFYANVTANGVKEEVTIFRTIVKIWSLHH